MIDLVTRLRKRGCLDSAPLLAALLVFASTVDARKIVIAFNAVRAATIACSGYLLPFLPRRLLRGRGRRRSVPGWIAGCAGPRAFAIECCKHGYMDDDVVSNDRSKRELQVADKCGEGW